MWNAWRVLRPFILLGLSGVAALAAPARYDVQSRIGSAQEYTQIHMGMPVRIRMYAGSSDDAREAAIAAFARIAVLDRMMSDYRPDSELRQLSAARGSWQNVSPELYDVLERAVAIASATDGAFDPSVGPLVLLWREARQTARMPDASAIARAREAVGWQRIEFDKPRRAVRLSGPGMRLDLGGIAKGYILDEALRTLRSVGVLRALIEAGGDIAVGDAPPDRDGWRIDAIGADSEFAARAAKLTNAALATSGPTAQFVEIAGVRYSHVVDPRTGVGLTNHVTAHVIAPDGATADALATALTVAPAGDVPRLLSRFPGVRVSVVQGP